ncbi:fatty acid desaturase [Conexibacter sp. CPCC 206217]|uniref:fatty acid desaturase n=1 Tax=Conexibacter sp. CPCC 206217 TaxID=3064574 RepID=UPI002723E70C|nr:fatty acid desaturase [Conexibacter sp. CPCC 206217]MDO8212632.1 fatty acid desaturase [Conexibacter sp. CPCC 206217]
MLSSLTEAPPTTVSAAHPANPWRKALAPYATPRLDRGVVDLATSIVPYLLLAAAMVALAPVSPLLTLALALPAAGFLLRTFIVFHDCAHGSFLPSKRANQWLGRVLGVVVYTPFGAWRHSHAMHHASAGDLDRRGHGDVLTMTVAEYHAASRVRRLAYRLIRHPAVMFTLGPFVAMALLPRLTTPSARPRIRNSVVLNDLVLAIAIAAFCVVLGWQTFLLVQVPIVALAGGAGVWLFFVQHQFEDVYWESAEEWSYADAALRGSSYLRLPKLLQFFSGNIGLHHVHHLSARIPNYNLQAAHDDNDVFHSVPQLTLWQGIRATRLKLWDEHAHRLVTFAQAR